MSSAPINAPDGIRFPLPIVAVSQEEQRPWGFGWHAYADRMTDRSLVVSDRADPGSVVRRKYDGGFHLVSADLPTGDYVLMGPDGPLSGFCCVERKERDLASSLTAEMGRFKEECERMRPWTDPVIITSCTLDALIRSFPQHEPAFVGGLAMIAVRYRIPVIMCPDRERAERFAAWHLVYCWQAWLTANPAGLAWAREEERRRGIVREHKRAQRKVEKVAT